MIEVEVKARVLDFSEIEEKIKKLKAEFIKTEIQEDIYFAHPGRDFKETDEAVRVRQINNKFFLTYKGPKLDAETKTREEIEVSVEKNVIEILKKLGFREWRSVKKERKTYRLNDLTVCLDDVTGLGKFIEVEIQVNENDDNKDNNNKDKIFELLGRLGIDRSESITKSYTELFDEK